ncbi:MAG: SemiSWEET transporter [Bacteroidia bacterium]
MNNITIIGVLASIGTGISLVPQLFKIIKEKKAEGISVAMLAVLLVGNGLWIYYGVLKSDLIIIISNSFSFLVNLIISVLKFRYKEESRSN